MTIFILHYQLILIYSKISSNQCITLRIEFIELIIEIELINCILYCIFYITLCIGIIIIHCTCKQCIGLLHPNFSLVYAIKGPLFSYSFYVLFFFVCCMYPFYHPHLNQPIMNRLPILMCLYKNIYELFQSIM